jgi:hypothetical protein
MRCIQFIIISFHITQHVSTFQPSSSGGCNKVFSNAGRTNGSYSFAVCLFSRVALCSLIVRTLYNYKKTKEELLRTNAAIWFNKICKTDQLTPKCIHITVGGSNRQSKNTKHAAIKYRLNQEIRFLYKKKQVLNEQLYRAHLECAKSWNGTSQCILTSTESKLQNRINTLYQKLNKNLCKLNKTTHKHETITQTNNNTFHERIQNLTSITLTSEETKLLKLGSNYALEKAPNLTSKT